MKPQLSGCLSLNFRKGACSFSMNCGRIHHEAGSRYRGASLTATVQYGYDSDGNLAKLTYPDGNVIDYTYTARNQLWQVQNGGPPPVATYAYDLAGRLTNLDRANGVNTVLTHGNNAGELTAVDHAKGANYVDGVLYSLNAGNGRREGITRSGGWNDVMIFHHTQCCCL
jgi:YD repeat-containing protein